MIKTVLVGVFGVVLSMNVFAADEIRGVDINGKKISISKEKQHGDEIALHSKDLKDGIYVLAITNHFGNPGYTNATRIIRERFAANGFKVVDKAEGASIGIRFMTIGDLGMDDADKAGSGSATSGEKLGNRVAAFVGGGVGSLGWIFSSDSHSTIAGFVTLKPVDEKLNKSASTDKDPEFNNNLAFTYSLEKDNKAPADAVLTMMVDEWIKHYMVLDAEPVAAASGVAVAPTAAVAAAK